MNLKVKVGDKVRFKKLALSHLVYSAGLEGVVVDPDYSHFGHYILIQMDDLPEGYLTPMIHQEADTYLEIV